MTLVVRAMLNEMPILIGDVLMSGKVRRDLDIRPPTVGWGSNRVPRLFVGDTGPAGLRRKVVCHKNLLFGWSGVDHVAANFVGRLNEIGINDDVSLSRVMDVCHAIPANGKLALTGWLCDGKELFGFTVGPRKEFKLGDGSEVVGIGSGVHFLEQLIQNEHRVVKGSKRTTELGKKGFEFAALLVVDLLVKELTTMEPLQQFFGGAYEIAGRGPDGFGTIQNLEYVFWEARWDNEDILLPTYPRQLYCLGYNRDTLNVAAKRLGVYSEGVWETELFSIHPIYRDPPTEEDEEWLRPKANAPLQAHVVVVKEVDHNYAHGFVSGLWAEDDLLIWTEDKHSVRHEVQPRLHERMAEFMRYIRINGAPS